MPQFKSLLPHRKKFSDSNYFIRAFKKIVGVTPGAFQMQAIHHLIH